jgi:hypothetical protein
MMKSLVVFPDVVCLVKRVDFGVLTQKKRISTVPYRINISGIGVITAQQADQMLSEAQ